MMGGAWWVGSLGGRMLRVVGEGEMWCRTVGREMRGGG